MDEYRVFAFDLLYGNELRKTTYRVPRITGEGEDVKHPAGDLWGSIELGEAVTVEFEGDEISGWDPDMELVIGARDVSVKIDCRYLVAVTML